jgi:hypothetical protein
VIVRTYGFPPIANPRLSGPSSLVVIFVAPLSVRGDLRVMRRNSLVHG